MHKPALYVKVNAIAPTDAEYTLKTNLELLKCNNNYAVLDVGCGPGNITYEKILPLLPRATKTLTGVDVSSHNIEYAKQHYQKDPRISYDVLDILVDAVPDKYVNTFDLLLSLHCLHYVGDHRKALINVFKMMKPKGKMLISFGGQSTLSDAYNSVYNNPKWKKYMNDFGKSIPVSQSGKYYKSLLEEIGFQQIECKEMKRVIVVSEQNAFDTFNALNVFPVPKSLEPDFIQDQMDYFENAGNLVADHEGKRQLNFDYSMFIITACKS